MNKIFIGGSRKVTHINKEVRIYIDQIMNDDCKILIGDANGVDKSVQIYLNDRAYNNVEVFCMENNCRNNIGGWIVRQISATHAKKDHVYYSTKDKTMADEASIGLMVWDGKSYGTVANAFRLIQQGKKVNVYINPTKTLLILHNLNDFDILFSKCTKEIQEKIDNYVKNFHKDTSKQRSLFEITL